METVSKLPASGWAIPTTAVDWHLRASVARRRTVNSGAFLTSVRLSPCVAYKQEGGPIHPGDSHDCLKSVHGGMLIRRGRSSRLHQWHGWMWVSFLGGGSHSANQGKQATLYLMITPASVPYLSSLCGSRQTRAQIHSQELGESPPAERFNTGFHRVISSQFNQI